ncbi:MAG: hypothetical protein HYU27_10795, partial [Acidobacteria bacterium]|nr:hypothetical protein [Acidobacteriota bacterium]
MERNSPAYPVLQRVQKMSLFAGMVALGLCAVGAALDLEQFFRSYLVAYLFWIGITLGCLTIVMMHSLTGGAWGVVTRRMLEAGAQTIGLMAVLFVPLALGARHLYGWLEAGAHAADRHPYLNAPFFFFRAALYFGCWLLLAYFLPQWSRERDETADSKLARKIRLLSAPGLILYVITATFASIDWVMSLEPHWRSTIFGVLFMGGQVLSACAFVIVVAALLARRQPLADRIASEHFHDLGNLLLSFVMLWAYFAFSQYLIIWSGNLPDE